MSYLWTLVTWLIVISCLLANATVAAYGQNWPIVIGTMIINMLGCLPLVGAARKADAWDEYNEGRIR